MKTSLSFFLLVLIAVSACRPYDLTKVQTPKVHAIYQNSLEDAVYPTTAKVDKNLFAINQQNSSLLRRTINGEEYILMVSWKVDDTYYKAPHVKADSIYNTGTSYPIWVTASPQLANWANSEPRFMKWVKDGEMSKVNLRIKQLLGLPPNPKSNYHYKYFVEFWVKKSDLFRPCTDAEITDSECSACFPAKVDTTYQAWVNDTRAKRYYNPCDLLEKYPWTALGYTYDWSPRNKNHHGLSEYVVKNNSNILVNKIYTTEEYLNR